MTAWRVAGIDPGDSPIRVLSEFIRSIWAHVPAGPSTLAPIAPVEEAAWDVPGDVVRYVASKMSSVIGTRLRQIWIAKLRAVDAGALVSILENDSRVAEMKRDMMSLVNLDDKLEVVEKVFADAGAYNPEVETALSLLVAWDARLFDKASDSDDFKRVEKMLDDHAWAVDHLKAQVGLANLPLLEDNPHAELRDYLLQVSDEAALEKLRLRFDCKGEAEMMLLGLLLRLVCKWRSTDPIEGSDVGYRLYDSLSKMHRSCLALVA